MTANWDSNNFLYQLLFVYFTSSRIPIDVPLFGEKDVAVVGGGNSALDAAIQLSKIARKI